MYVSKWQSYKEQIITCQALSFKESMTNYKWVKSQFLLCTMDGYKKALGYWKKTYQKKQKIFTVIFESMEIRQSHSVQRVMNNW